MTFAELKDQVSVLLIGDNPLPKDNSKQIAALKLAYIEIADMASPLKWLTLNKDVSIMRKAMGSYFIRMPNVPVDDTDELDIDSELVPAVARLLASYIAKEIRMKDYHRSLAKDILKKYEAKVRAFMLQQEKAGEYDNIGCDYA